MKRIHDHGPGRYISDAASGGENDRILQSLLDASRADERLALLVDEVREYAHIYLLAKARKRGCDGTGEFMTLEEEFRDSIRNIMIYCGEKGCPPNIIPEDLDDAVRLLSLPNPKLS